MHHHCGACSERECHCPRGTARLVAAAHEAGARDAGESELAVVLQALADPARLRVVEALSRSPQRAGDLAAAAGVPAPTMSKHLRVLLAAGIVTDEEPADGAGTLVEYSMGKNGDIYPEGTGRLLPAGARITWNLHLHSGGEAKPARVSARNAPPTDEK